MAKHKETGIKGEHIAENFLLKKGYIILHTNWRHGKKELDIVAEKGGVLIAIEVKTRRSFEFGYPEEAVSMRKQLHLKQAAEAFCNEHKQYTDVRFDVISILLRNNDVAEVLHFEDAFY